ncbi:hypothetical protein BDV32DRAFT_154600 [Aspergillus pseudonomiae]|uniref:Uncharacterized protein n=1 Tax=Aspergillus pseudonomiae TaxID=1506151 RepID=A0A5N6HKN6_9EURO|nr:uncharacterized protein BDV37DRAFT_293134 [Aspergillus pseudonomiae]KAB8255072.1 hypothetical protein BDV32DRAFT_154600 [Aspergillus pseudonomiae]KAE8405426.1 hypothetical protein BDV37DRAFT_293134 [Aspergillus pseudonomiae]
MHPVRAWLASWLMLHAQQGLSLVFEEISHLQVEPHSLAVRGSGYSNLDLLKQDSFYYSGAQNGQSSLANFTVSLPGEQENIVSMERFENLLESVHCTNTSVAMTFKEEQAFAYTEHAWQWINEMDDHSLVVVLGKGSCKWNANRFPFVVSSVTYDETTKTTKLQGQSSKWDEIAHTYELNIGKHTTSSAARRDIDRSTSVDFNHVIPVKSGRLPDESIDVIWDCADCSTQGAFELNFHVKTVAGIPKTGSFSLSPNGVSATFMPRLAIDGDIKDQKTGEIDIGRIPIAGISIPGGILNIGPQIVFSLGYNMGPVTGSATITAGTTVSLDDSAEVSFDLESRSVEADGWTPSVQATPVSVDAEIEGDIEFYPKASLQISVQVIGKGVEVGLNLKPIIAATMSAVHSTEGACPDDPKHRQNGVTVDPSASVTLNFEATFGQDDGAPDVDHILAEYTAPLESKCYPVGPEPSSTPTPSGSPTPSSSARPSSSPIPPSVYPTPSTTPSSAPPSSSTPLSSSVPPTPSSETQPTKRAHHHRRMGSHRRHGHL